MDSLSALAFCIKCLFGVFYLMFLTATIVPKLVAKHGPGFLSFFVPAVFGVMSIAVNDHNASVAIAAMTIPLSLQLWIFSIVTQHKSERQERLRRERQTQQAEIVRKWEKIIEEIDSKYGTCPASRA